MVALVLQSRTKRRSTAVLAMVVLATAGALSAATPARAYYAKTVASALGGLNGPGCQATYNAVGARDGALFLETGGSGTTPCPSSPYVDAAGATVSYSGTVDPSVALTGTAYASSDSADNVGSGFSSSAFAAADLASGTLRTRASSTPNANATAIAGFSDAANFTVAGAGATTITPIAVHLDLDGSIVDTVKQSPSSALLTWTMHFGSAELIAQISSTSLSGFLPRVDSAVPTGWLSSSFSAKSASSIHFDGVYGLIGDNPVFDVSGLLNLACNNGPTCDFSHTASIRLTLPAGVTLTSGSGVFLSAVPEPSRVLTMALGIGVLGLGSIARRRIAARAG